MKNCQNGEHLKKDCEKDSRCSTCGIYTCSPNFAYHVCIASLKKRNLKRKWKYDNASFKNRCKECDCTHRNSSGTGEIGETCFNCEILLKSFWEMVNALNHYTPINGKPRRITITGYKIEKI